MSLNIKAILIELRHRLELLYGDRLVKVVLFGSRARGDAGLDSDIDVARRFLDLAEKTLGLLSAAAE